MSGPFLSTGCFGKLPCYGDFLEVGAAQPTGRALKEWIFAGREGVGMEREESGAGAPSERVGRRFLFGLPGSVELVAGVIRPSVDQGERRRFPFALFTYVPRRLYGRHYELLPMALGPVWEALGEAWDNLAGVATRAAFDEVLASTRVPAPAPVKDVRASYEAVLPEAVNRIFDRNEGNLGALFMNLPSLVGRLRKGTAEEGLRVELPVSRGGGVACFDASFWLDLLNRQFLWKRFEPAVFLAEGSAEGNCGVLFIFGILAAQLYPLVMGCEGAELEVARPAFLTGAAESAPPPEHPSMTYAELLSKRFSATGQE